MVQYKQGKRDLGNGASQTAIKISENTGGMRYYNDGETQNISGLKDAGRLFKYEGDMPETDHYEHIGEDIEPEKALKKILKRNVGKMRNKQENDEFWAKYHEVFGK